MCYCVIKSYSFKIGLNTIYLICNNSYPYNKAKINQLGLEKSHQIVTKGCLGHFLLNALDS